MWSCVNQITIYIHLQYWYMVGIQYMAGWWLTYPLWKMMEFDSWDDEIPNWMESHKIHVLDHQPNGEYNPFSNVRYPPRLPAVGCESGTVSVRSQPGLSGTPQTPRSEDGMLGWRNQPNGDFVEIGDVLKKKWPQIIQVIRPNYSKTHGFGDRPWKKNLLVVWTMLKHISRWKGWHPIYEMDWNGK